MYESYWLLKKLNFSGIHNQVIPLGCTVELFLGPFSCIIFEKKKTPLVLSKKDLQLDQRTQTLFVGKSGKRHFKPFCLNLFPLKGNLGIRYEEKSWFCPDQGSGKNVLQKYPFERFPLLSPFYLFFRYPKGPT